MVTSSVYRIKFPWEVAPKRRSDWFVDKVRPFRQSAYLSFLSLNPNPTSAMLMPKARKRYHR